ncbi:MAG: hypothetical protein KGL98_00345 [Gammaproteobacteria bacterium]|nr:hypothetical protein [Gammaproteobacteria bacterium]MBU6508705.1 hypothetical protein [Gammaproteobacteria bacterium]MDE1982940.1 hypothetical protein [Gammaproteobacteria bacterium]MDE2108686.1 hypothetical protein [Gammaproteobacteria bacterium]MDE2459674.1 hypothetical protein [Gammaproteobacteria bacterium]
MKFHRSSTANNASLHRAQMIFALALAILIALIVMGVAGVHWPKWLLALTTVL